MPATIGNNHVTNNATSVKWSEFSEDGVLAYYNNTDKYLKNIYLPKEAILCKGVKCKNLEHKHKLCSMYDDIVTALYESGKPFDVQCKDNMKPNIRPGWEEHVAMYQDEAHVA